MKHPSPPLESQTTRFWLAAVLAPVAGIGITGGLFGFTSGLVVGAPFGAILAGTIAIPAGGALGVILGWPLMVAVGLPLAYFSTQRAPRYAQYIIPAAFALIGLAAAMSLVITMAQTNPAEYLRLRMGQPPSNFYSVMPWGALAGGLTGWLFWFIRR